MKIAGIYLITNVVNNKVYVGSSLNIFSRWSSHKHHLNRKIHHSKHLQAAWNKYGEENFKFGILEYIKDKHLLAGREQIWLNYFQSYLNKFGYNICEISYSIINRKHSAASKKKMSISKKGIKLSEETKRKMSIAKLGKRHGPESYAKTGNFHRGRKRSKETRLKMSLSKIGKSSNRRNKIKWPHKKGSHCLCRICRNKRNANAQIWKSKRKISHG